MKRPYRDRTVLRIFALLAISFLVVGGSVGALLVSQALENDRIYNRNELASLAQIAALQVDPEKHEALTSTDQQDSPSYNEQIDKLDRALELTNKIKFIYTLRQIGNEYFFVLDPTPPGDSDGDGVDDKSYLLDPYPEVPPAAKKALRTGSVQVDSEPTVDRWGTFISAYGPIKRADGTVVAVLGLDREYEDILAREQEIRDKAWLIAGLLVAVSLLVAWLLASRLAWRRATPEVRAARAGIVRSLAFEVILYAAVCTLTVVGILGHLQTSKDLRGLPAQSAETGRIAQIRTMLRKLPPGAMDVDTLTKLRALAQESNIGGLSNLLVKPEIAGDASKRAPLVAQIQDSLDAEVARLDSERDATLEGIDRRNNSLIGLFAMATVVSLGALILIRKAAKQQEDLNELFEENSRQDALYKHLMASLPIGLYAYDAQGSRYANTAWDNLVMRKEGETHHEALKRRLHREDAPRALTALQRSLDNREPFVIQFRLISDYDETQFLELRGVPVYGPSGEFEHMLAFSLDITRTVLARKQLHEKNREILGKNQQLSRALSDLEENLEAMVRALVKAVEAKDPYTAGHSERVMGYSVQIAEAMGLDENQVRILQMGTLIHDVGKIGVPDEILTKPSQLSNEEFEIIRAHPVVGYQMIEGIPRFQECAPIVRWHHERLDGRGYPDGLKGNDIPLLVRIASVADAFDAMTSTRAYRRGLTHDHAIDELRKDAEKGALDGEIIEVLAVVIRAQLISDEDLLSDAA
ncbi:MAG: HD domain-containing protein [Fimbriimonadaceae bacterium]|nr:HD domain-containing protein [Fimbriimonadaceae bacterium]